MLFQYLLSTLVIFPVVTGIQNIKNPHKTTRKSTVDDCENLQKSLYLKKRRRLSSEVTHRFSGKSERHNHYCRNWWQSGERPFQSLPVEVSHRFSGHGEKTSKTAENLGDLEKGLLQDFSWSQSSFQLQITRGGKEGGTHGEPRGANNTTAIVDHSEKTFSCLRSYQS